MSGTDGSAGSAGAVAGAAAQGDAGAADLHKLDSMWKWIGGVHMMSSQLTSQLVSQTWQNQSIFRHPIIDKTDKNVTTDSPGNRKAQLTNANLCYASWSDADARSL